MKKLLVVLLAVLIFLSTISIAVGKYYIDPVTVLRILLAKFVAVERDWKDQMETIVWKIRFPRVVSAVVVGAGLALSAAILQSMFQNPLVSPFILGVSSGAGFGACVAIVLGLNMLLLQLSVFVGGIVAVALTCILGSDGNGGSKISLVLAGVIVGGFFTSLISAIKYLADPYEKLPAIVYWMMGSLAYVSNESLFWTLPVIVISTGVLYLYRWKFNILALGDREALALGEDTRKLKMIGIVFTTLLVSATVALAGVIGWVGLVIANMTRMITGPDLNRLIPVSALLGAIYLLLIDDLARTLATVEIPLGILTSLVGAPVFIYILRKSQRRKD
jgi:iron complex transport system permease protein